MFKIVSHHVGGRGYGVSFNVPLAFRDDVVHVLYEADADAVRRMELELDCPHAQMLSEKYVLPYCLGRKNRHSLLNITRNSYASSLFAPNEDFHRYYCEIPIDVAVYDVLYAPMLEVVAKVEVEVHSLDELLASGKVPISRAPDFLSLDTQGYELEVLHGAKKALSEGVLALVSEVEMLPMYAGQPLLGDVLNFATAHGFIFAGFTSQYEVSPHRAPIGARGRALPGFGDALFFRDIKTLTEDQFPSDQLYVMLHKLAFIAISFGFVEYGIAAIKSAEELSGRISTDLNRELGKYGFGKFLSQMKLTLSQLETLFPPVHAVPDDSRPKGDTYTSWYNKYHQAALSAFRDSESVTLSKVTDSTENPRDYVKGYQLTDRVYNMLPEQIGRWLRRRLYPAQLTPKTLQSPESKRGIKTYTPFEELLNEWGFVGPAYIVRQRRLAAEPFVRSLSPAMTEAGKHAHIQR